LGGTISGGGETLERKMRRKDSGNEEEAERLMSAGPSKLDMMLKELEMKVNEPPCTYST
jgi:hypothetical protein